MIPLLGYTPNLPATTPGAILHCTNLLPTETAMRAASAPEVDVTGPSSGSVAPIGFAMLDIDDATVRTLYGTTTKIYDRTATFTWTDVSRAGDYSLGAGTKWSFAQLGATSVAANIDVVIQTSTGSGVDFADQATAPQAAIVVSALSSGGGFVLAFNTIDGTYGTRTDAWWCCAANDVTSWTPSIAKQCATGRLLGQDGPIVAAKRFGADMVVAYKAASLYVGRYVGGDVVWQWQEYPGFGCVGPDAVADLGGAHIVADRNNGLYIFDGARAYPIGKEEIGPTLGSEITFYGSAVRVIYEKAYSRVRILTTSNGYAYNLVSKKWGRQNVAALGAAISDVSSVYGGVRVVMSAAGVYKVYTLTGDPESSTLQVNWIGDDSRLSMLTECYVRYDDASFVSIKLPSTASVQAYSSMWLRDRETTGPAVSSSDTPGSSKGRFTLRQTARWHNLVFSFTGDHAVVGFDVKLKSIGGLR